VRQLRDAIIELIEAVFSMHSVPRSYTQEKSRVMLVGRESPASKDVNMDAKEVTALEAGTRQ
jgi:hypothetical protein